MYNHSGAIGAQTALKLKSYGSWLPVIHSFIRSQLTPRGAGILVIILLISVLSLFIHIFSLKETCVNCFHPPNFITKASPIGLFPTH